MPSFVKSITAIMDVLDENYIEAIKTSADQIFELFIPDLKDSKKSGNKILVSDSLLKFWASLGNKTYDEVKNADFNLYILPLNRVGAAEGASGSRVFVIYFAFADNETDHS